MNVRLDRFLTLYVFGPLMRSGQGKRPGIPILMYHSISKDIEPGLHPYYQTTTSPQRFQEHMRLLYENGYSVISLQDAVHHLNDRGYRRKKFAVLTFDDGFLDFYDEAFPILKRYGFPSTVFLPAGFMDGPKTVFKNRRCLTWGQVRELSNHGVDFGSHTMTHPMLVKLDKEAIRWELVESKKRIEANLDRDIRGFCYPFAFPEADRSFVKMLRGLLIDAGYSYGVTTTIGIADEKDDSLFLKRIPINEFDDEKLLTAKLIGEYSWLGFNQRIKKTIDRHLNLPCNCLCRHLDKCI